MNKIDVSKCEYFEEATCFDNDFDEIEFDYCKLFDEPCEDVRNNNRCTYKLKQQIQQLKQAIKDRDYYKQIVDGCKSENGNCSFCEIDKQLQQLKQENEELKKLNKMLSENNAVQQWADMYNKKDKEHFDCQLKLALAEQKLEKIKEICKPLLEITTMDRLFGAEHTAEYHLAKNIKSIIEGEK